MNNTFSPSDFDARKSEESRLLRADGPGFFDKVKAAARLKAAFVLADADGTETDWSQRSHRSGPYTFHYDYQRADLTVEGPHPYSGTAEQALLGQVFYTSGGMAALAAAALALSSQGSTLSLPRGCYSETRELAELLGRARYSTFSAALVDSAAPKVELPEAAGQLVVFDTSCFAIGSGRLRKTVRHLLNRFVHVVLVRSVHKLDMLGVEYGRLGSGVIVGDNRSVLEPCVSDAIRLIGAAARPDDFPPFAEGTTYRAVSRARTANIMRNTRLLGSRLLQASIPIVAFQHGLYLDIELTAGTCREAAAEVAEHLASAVPDGLMRHAGSFGFDFTASEWTDHPLRDAVALRIAPGDQRPDTFAELAAQIVAVLPGIVDRFSRFAHETAP